MSIVSSRRVRRVVVVCLVLLTLFVSSAASGAREREARGLAPASRAARVASIGAGQRDARAPRALHAGTPALLHAGDRELLGFAPPRASAPPSTVVYLHGAHGRPENGCPWLRAGASEVGWLVCPEGAERDRAGGWSWGADVLQQQRIVLAAVRAAQAAGASDEPAVAVGFSQGSYVALDLIKARLATFRALVLIGADVHPNVGRLRAAGVKRVALAAGARDAVHASMKEEAARLASEGLEARFFDLGAVGHTYAAEDPTVLGAAVAWASAR